uniref:Uncharacterized protein n=1 Tax=Arundo donax TaxID=35708 RepID=A0A0A9ET04_ARUDO
MVVSQPFVSGMNLSLVHQ